jgi:cytoskeletal protein CcmA (bactofilin family)
MWGKKKSEPTAEIEFAAAPVAPRAPAEPVAPVVSPVRVKTGSVIAAGTVITGSITSSGDVLVDGAVTGDVRANALTVGKEGSVIGNVAAETATIRGKVHGDVRARTIQLAAQGAIEGDLTHAVLIIEEGGSFEGRSRRSSDPLADETPQLAAPDAAAPSNDEPAATVVASEAEKPSEDNPVVASADLLEEEPRSALADALGDAFKEKV